MIIDGSYISCPKCGWEPTEQSLWICSCRNKWNTFDTAGECPACGKVWKGTQCLSCHNLSPHSDWYETIESPISKQKEKFVWFWQKKTEAPITKNDRLWVEDNLLWFVESFTPEVFRSLVTITPDKQYFERNFTGKEDDADFILERVASIMKIKPWEIQLMFFSDRPTRFSEGITATPAEKLEGGWSSKKSDLIDKGFGNKEIWIEMCQLDDPVALIATMSVELAKYKLMSEFAIEKDISMLADLMSLAFGFGIFKGNSYFKFAQWHGNTHHGWQMQKSGGLPEPIIAYTLAWLAYYRDEDVSWKQYLNRTMKKYFEKSYAWIGQNKDKVKWSLGT